jgi:hypothetical protein
MPLEEKKKNFFFLKVGDFRGLPHENKHVHMFILRSKSGTFSEDERGLVDYVCDIQRKI